MSAFATVELPADLLPKEGTNEGTAIIRLIRTPLSQGITDRLGAGHGVQIEFSLNHQNFMPDREISIELPYTSSKDTVADKVIAVQMGASGEIKPPPQSYYDPQRGEIIFSANALSLTGAYLCLIYGRELFGSSRSTMGTKSDGGTRCSGRGGCNR